MNVFWMNFYTSNFYNKQSFSQLTYKKVSHIFWKPWKGKWTQYLKMGVEGEKIWKTLYAWTTRLTWTVDSFENFQNAVFLKVSKNSFHRVTRYGLKSLQFFSFKNISTNTIAKRKNWKGFRPYLVTLWKEFEISLKKRRFENFWTSQPSRSI